MGRYIYPPRPEGKITPRQLPDHEATGRWICQRKFNGDRCPIQFDGKPILWNRRGKKQKYKPIPSMVQALQSLDVSGECWIDAELMHSQTEGWLTDTLVIFDLLQFDGQNLMDLTQVERLQRLHEVCRSPIDKDEVLGYCVAPEIFLAESWDSDFVEHFNESKDVPYIEGLVLRQKDSHLDNFGASEYEVDWQIRCRRSTKGYRH